LLRDFNESLLSHPFDQELKDLGKAFGQLLRGMVETIDAYGLKKRYLKRHKDAVEQFFRGITLYAAKSEAGSRLANRLNKYRSKLFTFLDYDGIPWNNNNAEHAIKHFAKYRRLANGRFTECGLRDYLKLLSIYETCKYKEIGFLDFLLSKHRDIDRV
jgi:hypothetical protein